MNSWILGSAVNASLNIVSNSTSVLFQYPCNSTSNCTWYETSLPGGYYKVEVWGAQGGESYCMGRFKQAQGKGGYSVGVLFLTEETKVYVYIGGQGESGMKPSTRDAKGGFNGGGDSQKDDDNDDQGGAGGGATDIRINGNQLENRVIVAGDGGENGWDSGYYGYWATSYGGGIEGGRPRQYQHYGTAASQTDGYSLGFGEKGQFFGGASSGGGGGGYYGANTIWVQYGGGSGGGGSGYIGKVISFSGIEKKTIPGNETIPTPTGDPPTSYGWSDNGAARITVIGYFLTLTDKIEDCYSIYDTIHLHFRVNTLGSGEECTVTRVLDGQTKVITHTDEGTPFTIVDDITPSKKLGNYTIEYTVTSKSGDVTTKSIPIAINYKPRMTVNVEFKMQYAKLLMNLPKL
ncbi:loricrin, putative [Trichomonas vaginalis G3]|uniref:receptor protein-tyrosine kinase n=1 Tax=Trichomonas vaginalis (strain ATCC PRA-98 / G3) TaxID=412133 RepID=A2ECP8_TRIV3|nr:glycine-rich protein family [Trichomonas vaginalis G3]EAY09544.1 loricrin, putative [Trichomonas vaginalis G3]KAI5533171.1 glycine-rich protein family [Trichomonas vaginalis G3]|eukprot:XP_001321767.1 loricrin [Trichomonas vaginalis G3]